MLVVEVVLDFDGRGVSDAVLVRWVHDNDFRVPTVTDLPTPVGTPGPTFALFGRREIAVVVDLGTMQVVQKITGVTGCATPPAMCDPTTAMWQAIDAVIRLQGGTVGGG